MLGECVEKGDADCIIRFIASVLPSSPDYAVEIGALGPYTYYITSRGVVAYAASLDETLPFVKSREHVYGFRNIPDTVKRQVLLRLGAVLSMALEEAERGGVSNGRLEELRRLLEKRL